MMAVPPSWILVGVLSLLSIGLGLAVPAAYNAGEAAEAARVQAQDKAEAEAYAARLKPVVEASTAEQTTGAARVRAATREDVQAAGRAQIVIEATADEDAAYRAAVRPPGPHAERMRAIERAAAAGSDPDRMQR